MVDIASTERSEVDSPAARRPRYVNAKQASAMLEGVVSPADLRRWARQGHIVGAIRVGPKAILFDRRLISTLIKDLSAETVTAGHSIDATPRRNGTDDRPLVWHDRRGHVTFDPRPLN